MYADDLELQTGGAKKKATQVLENKLNKAMAKLQSWCENNNMTVNTNKTIYQTFSECYKPLQL